MDRSAIVFVAVVSFVCTTCVCWNRRTNIRVYLIVVIEFICVDDT